jgi:hypothetical protein
LLTREVVRRLYHTSDTTVKVSPASVVCLEDGKGEARRELQTEVDLAILPRVFCGFSVADAGCKLLVEVWE